VSVGYNICFFMSRCWIMFTSHVKCDGWEAVFLLARFLIISSFFHRERVLDRQHGAQLLLCTLQTDVKLSAERGDLCWIWIYRAALLKNPIVWVVSGSQDLPCLNKPWQSGLPPAIALLTHLSLADALSTQTSAVSLSHSLICS